MARLSPGSGVLCISSAERVESLETPMKAVAWLRRSSFEN